MAKTLILYASKYGATEKYAQSLAQSLHADLLKTADATSEKLSAYESIIFGGGLYAGRVNGLKVLTQNWTLMQNKRVAVFLVGMTPPEASADMVAKAIPAQIKDHAGVFYLRGAVPYEKMGFLTKLLMKAISKSPVSLDFVDEKALVPIIEYVTQWS